MTESRTLGLLTDELNRVLEQLSAALIDLNLGVAAEVQIDDCVSVVFGKSGGAWGLWMVTLSTSGSTYEPLTSVSRGLRLEAVDHLGALVDQLMSTHGEEMKVVSTAIAKVAALIQRISKPKQEA